MTKKNIGIIVPVLFLFIFAVRADVPPEKGFARVGVNLVTETSEDLADYSFFLDFYGDLREAEIKSPGRTEIPPMGGGARYSNGTLWAIPKKSLGGYEVKLSGEQSDALSRALKKGEIEGAVELARHRFSMDVPKGEKAPEVYYVLKRADKTMIAERIAAERSKSDPSAQTAISDSRTGLIVGGVLIAFAALAAGIFAFRKVSKKV